LFIRDFVRVDLKNTQTRFNTMAAKKKKATKKKRR